MLRKISQLIQDTEAVLDAMRRVAQRFPDARERRRPGGAPFVTTESPEALDLIEGVEVSGRSGNVLLYPYLSVGVLRVYPAKCAGQPLRKVLAAIPRSSAARPKVLQAASAPIEEAVNWRPARKVRCIQLSARQRSEADSDRKGHTRTQ
ncbi:MAG: hypothetical protein HUU21_09465 [Polyangiaceae bacterium]|nr:hypothetical protein [Polyangiaceae bacterium]